MTDADWMHAALSLAGRAAASGEVPVGAVLVKDDKLLAEGWNRPIASHDPTAHAEVMALRAAGQSVGNYRLAGTTLYVTLEPCAMCAGAIVHARINRVVIAAKEPRAGAAGSALNVLQNEQLNHRCELTIGLLEEQSANLLKCFFKEKRN